jgi:hypothetical protein
MTLLFPKPEKRIKKPKAMKRRGDKTDQWDTTRAQLKVRFEMAGVTTCELRYPGCWKNNALSFAHSKKRRKIEGDELSECILVCVPCHNRLEYGQNDMYEIVRRVIAARKVKV